MIRQIFLAFSLMAVGISIGTYVIYKFVGTYSGQDALCISGIVTGIAVGLWFGKRRGLVSVMPILWASLLVSIPLVVLSLSLAHALQDLVESIAPLSIGFSLLASNIWGCAWGQHLTRP